MLGGFLNGIGAASAAFLERSGLRRCDGTGRAWFRLAVPVDSALAALARSLGDAPAERYDVRILRTDLRQEGDLAAAWVTIRRRTPVSTTTVERDWMEHLVLRRLGGEWRLLSVAATQWPRRR